jgi:hypothetical protein
MRNEFASKLSLQLKLLLWCYHIYKILYKQSDYWRFLLSDSLLYILYVIREGVMSFSFLLYFIIILLQVPWRSFNHKAYICSHWVVKLL